MATSAGVAVGTYGGLIGLALLFAGQAVVAPQPKRVDVTFEAPPPPPPPVVPPKVRMEPRPEPKPVLTQADVAPPTAPPAAPPPAAVPSEIPKTSAPESDAPQRVVTATATAGASLGAGSVGTVGGTGTQAINLPESGEPAIASSDNVPPRMPSEALAGGWEGRVVLKGVINVDGTVSQLQVLRVSVTIGGQTTTATADHPFAREALEAVREWHFTPAKVNGTPVAVYRIFPITYVSRS